MPLELPAPAVPCVAQLLYQPIHGRVASSAAKLSAMRDQVCTSAMDGSALALAVALRDLAALGVSATDESLNGPGGSTPVHMAVEANQPSTLAVLVDAGCAVNVRNRVGDTAAHVAARNGSMACLRLLGSPKALADFSAKDTQGRTSSEIAAMSGHLEAAALIASLTATDEGVHMAGRRQQEALRQCALVKLKQRLYGRSVVCFEGGHEFEIPERALLNVASRARVASDVAAFAVVPYILKQGLRRAIFTIAAQAKKLPLLEAEQEQTQQQQARSSDSWSVEHEEQVGGEALSLTPSLPLLMSATSEPATSHVEATPEAKNELDADASMNLVKTHSYQDIDEDRRPINAAPTMPVVHTPAPEAAAASTASGNNSRRGSSSGSSKGGKGVGNSAINDALDNVHAAAAAERDTSRVAKRYGVVSSADLWSDDDFDDDDPNDLIPSRVQRGHWK